MPDIIEKLKNSKIVIRLKNISQEVAKKLNSLQESVPEDLSDQASDFIEAESSQLMDRFQKAATFLSVKRDFHDRNDTDYDLDKEEDSSKESESSHE